MICKMQQGVAMARWSEINARERSGGLQAAVRRQSRPGEYRYTFVHDELEIDDPALDASGPLFASPRDYGFVSCAALTVAKPHGPATLPTAPCWL